MSVLVSDILFFSFVHLDCGFSRREESREDRFRLLIRTATPAPVSVAFREVSGLIKILASVRRSEPNPYRQLHRQGLQHQNGWLQDCQEVRTKRQRRSHEAL